MWSRIGCQTELPQEVTYQKLKYQSLSSQDRNKHVMINCTCTQLSTYAVLVDVIDPKVSNYIICNRVRFKGK